LLFFIIRSEAAQGTEQSVLGKKGKTLLVAAKPHKEEKS